MSMEQQVVDAIVAELQRQADEAPSRLQVGPAGSGRRIPVQGEVDLDALAQAVVGSVAGGP